MRLGVDGYRLMGRRLGVGRYLEYLLREWSREAPGCERIRVYVPSEPSEPLPLGGAVSLHPLESRWKGRAWEHAVLPLRKPADDLFFCPGYVIPLLSRERPVVVTHHGSYEAIPEAFPWLERHRARLVYRSACRRADLVITVSESSKRDIVRFYGVAAGKIRVIPPGVDGAFRPLSDPAVLHRRRRAYFADGRPYVLFVGKLSRRRNIPQLVTAFARLRARLSLPHGLVLIGPDLVGQRVAELAAAAGVADDVAHRSFARHDELVEAYNAADLFVYPSSYEGFGLPVLEAMACGTPTVTLGVSAMPEFAAGVAHFARDGGADALEEAIASVLRSEEARRAMRREGPRRAAAYRWRDVAHATLEALLSVVR